MILIELARTPIENLDAQIIASIVDAQELALSGQVGEWHKLSHKSFLCLEDDRFNRRQKFFDVAAQNS
jgi:hypothetical protein